MIICPVCGNKRCPKASNHILECTHSNEPGQKGSMYEKSLSRTEKLYNR
jgi:ribosomal protein L37AE/L43A